MRTKTRFITLVFLLILIVGLIPKIEHPTLASDFDINVDLTYVVQPSGKTKIIESRRLKNTSSHFFYPSSAKEIFTIKPFKSDLEEGEVEEFFKEVKASLKVVDRYGNNIDYEMNEQEDSLTLEVGYGTNLNSGEEKVFQLEYETNQLVERVGNIFNVYVPGFSGNFNKEEVDPETGATTGVVYSVALKVPKSLGEANFIAPEAVSTKEEGDNYVYSFSIESLVNQFVWLQIGDKQYYKFKIIETVSSSSKNFISGFLKEVYEIVLPSNSSRAHQSVYYSNFSVEPISVTRTDEGNLLAKFEIDPSEVDEIVIEGVIVVNGGQREDFSKSGDIEDIDFENIYIQNGDDIVTYEDLTKAEQYWESDSEEIIEKAKELKGEKENVYEIVLADYKFVVDSVDYDDLKLGVLNERQGALRTLKGGSAVCMEYSDLLIALLRAQGIPARAVFGYSYDPKDREGQTEGHQWVEAYIPNIGWTSLDPTWGDTGRRDYIGIDLDHAQWYVAGLNVNEPSKVVRYSYGTIGEVESPDFNIEGVEEFSVEQYMDQDDLLGKYPEGEKKTALDYVQMIGSYRYVLLGVMGIIIFVLLLTLLKQILKGVSKIVNVGNKVDS